VVGDERVKYKVEGVERVEGVEKVERVERVERDLYIYLLSYLFVYLFRE